MAARNVDDNENVIGGNNYYNILIDNRIFIDSYNTYYLPVLITSFGQTLYISYTYPILPLIIISTENLTTCSTCSRIDQGCGRGIPLLYYK